MNRIFIKPAPFAKGEFEGDQARKVRKPVNGHLAAEGEEVNRDSYWLRRLADGDVVEATAPADAPAPAATPAKAAK